MADYSPYPDENGVRHAPPGAKPATPRVCAEARELVLARLRSRRRKIKQEMLSIDELLRVLEDSPMDPVAWLYLAHHLSDDEFVF